MINVGDVQVFVEDVQVIALVVVQPFATVVLVIVRAIAPEDVMTARVPPGALPLVAETAIMAVISVVQAIAVTQTDLEADLFPINSKPALRRVLFCLFLI